MKNQCCYLLCSNLSVNHLCIVGINFKFSCLFSCDIRKRNCDLLSKLTKLGTSFAIMLNSSFLFLYALHWDFIFNCWWTKWAKAFFSGD